MAGRVIFAGDATLRAGFLAQLFANPSTPGVWFATQFGIDGSYAMGSAEDAVNQYSAAPGEVSREYDANGNLIRVETAAGMRRMGYDHGNRMVRFEDEAGRTGDPVFRGGRVDPMGMEDDKK